LTTLMTLGEDILMTLTVGEGFVSALATTDEYFMTTLNDDTDGPCDNIDNLF